MRHKQLFSFRINDTGQTNADAFNRVLVLFDESVRKLNNLLQGLLNITVGGKLLLLQHSAGQVTGSHHRLDCPQIHADGYRVCCTQRQQGWRTSASGLSAYFLYQVIYSKLLDDERDSRAL